MVLRRGRKVARRGRKRVYRRRRMMRPRMRRYFAPLVHRVKELALSSSGIASPASTSAFGTLTFNFGSITNAAALRQLYDLYRIKAVKVKIIPSFNSADAFNASAGGTTGLLPQFYIAPNRDIHAPAPTSLPDLLNDDGVKCLMLDRPYTFYLSNPKPYIDVGTVGSPETYGGQTQVRNQLWLSTGGNGSIVDQSNIPHYGMRWVLVNNSNWQVSVTTIVTYYLEFKEQD